MNKESLISNTRNCGPLSLFVTHVSSLNNWSHMYKTVHWVCFCVTRFQWSRRKACCLGLLTCFCHFCYWEQWPSHFSEDLWVKPRESFWICPALQLVITEIWGHKHSMVTVTLLALLQVVLDCPLDTCFTYIYQYEPYLKDPVGFPRIMVSLDKNTPVHTWFKPIFPWLKHGLVCLCYRCWCICFTLHLC